MKKISVIGKRLCSLLMAAALFLTLAPSLPVSAANHPQTYSKMSSSYKSSVYYQNLMAIELTGDPITDLLQVAYSQLGYKESAKKNQLGGDGDGDGNCTEYGLFTGTNGYAWCASFVSWCFREAGIPKSVMPTSAGVGGLRKSVYSCGATWHSVDSGYKPKVGDLVIYEGMDSKYTYYIYASRDKNGVPSTSSHVGIVVEDFDEKSKTYAIIDGNGNGGKVKYLDNQKLYMAGPTKNGGTLNRIQGFITPDYYGKNSSSGSSGGSQKGSAALSAPTSSTYTSKQKVTDTNAVVVTKITKTSGSSITQTGVTLFSADGTIIKDYSEKVTNVSKSTTSFHSWFDMQKDLGVALTPGTAYKYQCYVVVDGQTFKGDVRSFTTTGKPSGSTSSSGNSGSTGSKPQVTLTPPTSSSYTSKQRVTDTNAVVVTQITKPSGSNITRSGVTLFSADGRVIKDYSEKVTNVRKTTTSFHSWFDIRKELGVTLTPGTAYKYQFYAVVDGQTCKGDVRSFTTTGTSSGGSSSSSSGSAPSPKATLSVPTDPAYTAKQKVTDTNAVVVTQIAKVEGSSITQSGVVLSAADGTVIKDYSEQVTNVGKGSKPFHSWFDIQKELGITLTPGTAYKYQFYAVVDGQTYWGDVRSFTTTGTAPRKDVAEAAPAVTFDGNGQAEITTAARQLVCHMQKPYGSRMGRVTVAVYSLDGQKLISVSASGGSGQDSLTDIDLTCTVSEQSMTKLTPGQAYLYEIQVVVDSQSYTSSRFDLMCR